MSIWKERFIRGFPGRLRVEVFGLQQNRPLAEQLKVHLLRMEGIKQVEPCIITGRVSITYHPHAIQLEQICKSIQMIELAPSRYKTMLEESPISTDHSCDEDVPIQDEVAVGLEHPEAEEQIPLGHFAPVPDDFLQIPQKSKVPSSVPWGLGIALGGLTFLTAKRLFVGKSALASSPMLFAASGILSVATGYPFLRRGFEQLNQERKWNSDLILGATALGLGLLRENLVVLAGLSILQYIHWKRTQVNQIRPATVKEEQYLSPSIRTYSEKIGKWAFPLAGATWAITRNPLTGLAVLLAANPRPAIVPSIATWKKAETELQQNQGWIPTNGTLNQLAHTQTVLVEDTSQLFHSSTTDLQILSEDGEEERIWNIVSSLLAKTEHPWKQAIAKKAKETHRTIKTAFHVEASPDGTRGVIHQNTYYFGSLAYIQKHKLNVDPYLLKLKRMQKNNTEAYCLVQVNDSETKCLGVIYQENHPPTSLLLSIRKHLEQTGRQLAVLHNSLQVDHGQLAQFHIQTDWLSFNQHERKEKVLEQLKRGEELLLVRHANSSSELLQLLPSITDQQLKELPQTIQYADEVNQKIHQQFRITKLFNLAGLILAIPFRTSAIMINLMADALSLVFLSRLKEQSRPSTSDQEQTSIQEIAVTACPSLEAPMWYSLEPQEVATYFCVDESMGLNQDQVQAYRTKFGLNQLVHAESEPWWKSYLGQFKEFTTLLLLGTTLLSFLTGDIFNGIAMGVVLMLNAAIGTIQERKAEKVVEALNQYQTPQTTVIRNGAEMVINGKELVPGDLVRLEAGDRAPADIRLIHSWNLEVDESMLTGESLPVLKTTAGVEAHCPLTERVNMVYKGTSISRGRGIGIVVATGMQTEMGHLMELLENKSKEMTPLQQEVTGISKTFIKGALAVTALIFGIGLIRGNSFYQMVPTSIALAASAIPEGLPVTVTIALSAGIFRMAKKSTLIRKLSALETLGRVHVICTDKTGTLTKNEMTVRSVATLGNEWSVTGEGYNPDGVLINQQSSPNSEQDLKQLIQIATLCNNTALLQEGDRWMITGDPTEGALLTLAHKSGISPTSFDKWSRKYEIPFDSATGKMSVVCRDLDCNESEQTCLVLTKGSIEAILNHCLFVQHEGKVVPITDEYKQLMLKINQKWASQSLRVLAFAYRPIHWDGNEDGIENDLIFVGMVGMIDPPKPDIVKSIREALELGVKPVMITGDHPMTAYAIAKEVGIHHDPQVLTGAELDQLSDEELLARINQISVFARVAPEHKLRIVHAYQRLGHKVAMTGDGVNDAPAIKQADVGIAMGQTGTEVTKETADIVLEKDHFGSIVEGVKEGRTIVSNIRKALGCLLTGNLAEILVTGVAVLAGMPIPLVPIQILVMNLLTDALPAMILATNPSNKTKQTKRIQLADKDLYSKVIIRGTLLGLGSLGLFATSLAMGTSLPVAQTIAFATLVCGQLIQTFSWRQEGSKEQVKDWMKDRFLMGALGVSALALLSTIYIPAFASFFHTAPLQANEWLKVLLVAGSVTTLSKPVYWFINKKKFVSDKPMEATPLLQVA